jgi:hypothetical protein
VWNRTLLAEPEFIVTGEPGAPSASPGQWRLRVPVPHSTEEDEANAPCRPAACPTHQGSSRHRLTANSFVQHTLRRKGLLPPALPERFGRCGHLHDQTTLALPDGNEVGVLVEGLRFVVYGINDDEPAAADFRYGDGFA